MKSISQCRRPSNTSDRTENSVRAARARLYGHKFTNGLTGVQWDAQIEYEDGETRVVKGGIAQREGSEWDIRLPQLVLTARHGERFDATVHLSSAEYQSVRHAILTQLEGMGA